MARRRVKLGISVAALIAILALAGQYWEQRKLDEELIVAAAAADFSAVKKLVGAGANPNVQRGLRPLHFAAGHGHVAMARYLLEHGAKVDAPAHDGRTALELATHLGNDEVAAVLREHGARE